jgi:hypothetical protein
MPVAIRIADLILDVVKTVILQLAPGCTTLTEENGTSEDEITITLQPRSGTASRIIISTGPHAQSVFVELGEATTIDSPSEMKTYCDDNFVTY